MDLELVGKRAMVTGGSRGIGLAVARALAAEGADVALVARDSGALEAARESVAAQQAKGRVIAVAAGTRSEEPVRQMAATVAAEFGGADILVNSAARPNTGAVIELGKDGINVTGVRPGMTLTERIPPTVADLATARGVTEAEVEESLASRASIGRMVTAEEVASALAFLASPKSVAINGDAIAVGGGAPGPIYY